MASKDLVINEWYKGIAESPHLGFGAMRNVDITSVPGVVQANLKLTKVSGSTITGMPKWAAVDPRNGNIWVLDTDQKVYKSTDDGASWSHVSGNTTSGGVGEGLAIWKDYLFVARDNEIDVYGPLSGVAAWSNSWKTDLTPVDANNAVEATHPMLVGQDDVLYIGNSRYVASVSENTGQTFAPATAASFTYTAQALDLPTGYKVRCLAELGQNLMIGTWRGFGINDTQVADIFPWDRVSSSFGLPIRLQEFGVHALLTVNNLMYIIAGVNGSVYVSNGTSTRLLRKIPDDLTNFQGGAYANFMPGAIAYKDNKIYFGMSAGGTNVTTPVFGVWSVSTTGTLNFEYAISDGTIDFNGTHTIGLVFPVAAGRMLVGWRVSSTYGLDLSESSTRYTNYLAEVPSPMYRVGNPLQPTQFQEIDVILDKPLASGDGIRIKYRSNRNDSFTTLGTYDFSTDGIGAVDNFHISFPSPSFVNLQFLIGLTQNASLREIRIR